MTLGQRIKMICLSDLSVAEYCLQLIEDIFHPSDKCWMCFAPDCRSAEEVEYWLKQRRSNSSEFLWFDNELDKLALWGIPLLSDPKSKTTSGGKYTYERLISVSRLRASTE